MHLNHIFVMVLILTGLSFPAFSQEENVKDYKITRSLDHLGYLPIEAIAFSPDSKYLFTLTQVTDENKRNAIKILDLTTNRDIEIPSPFNEVSIEKMVFSPDGSKIGILTEEGLFIFDLNAVQNFKLSLLLFVSELPNQTFDFAFTPNSKGVIWASRSVGYADFESGKNGHIETQQVVRGVGFDGKSASIVAVHNNAVSIIKSGSISFEYQMPSPVMMMQETIPVSPNGKYALVDATSAIILDTGNATIIKELSDPDMGSSIYRARFSSDSTHILLEGKDKKDHQSILKAYDIIQDQWKALPGFSGFSVEDFALNADGSKAAVSALNFKTGQSHIFILE